MPTPAELVPDLKVELSQILKVLVPEKFLAGDSTGKVFSAWEKNWAQRPPAIVRLNGVQQTTGYAVNYKEGTVTFTVAPTDVVTAEFYFSPFSDDELAGFAYRATRQLSSLIGEDIDTTAELPTLYEAPVTILAKKRVYDAVWGSVADYHRWEIDGTVIDKTAVAKAYGAIVKQQHDEVMFMVHRLRLLVMSGGTSIATAALTGAT
jgi:hypothetical protein